MTMDHQKGRELLLLIGARTFFFTSQYNIEDYTYVVEMLLHILEAKKIFTLIMKNNW